MRVWDKEGGGRGERVGGAWALCGEPPTHTHRRETALSRRKSQGKNGQPQQRPSCNDDSLLTRAGHGDWRGSNTGHTTDVATPQLLSTFAGKEIRKVAAGGGYDDDAATGFSLALSAGGTLFAFGSNARGQLGACPECSAAVGRAWLHACKRERERVCVWVAWFPPCSCSNVRGQLVAWPCVQLHRQGLANV
jgi:hypothetical protein